MIINFNIVFYLQNIGTDLGFVEIICAVLISIPKVALHDIILALLECFLFRHFQSQIFLFFPCQEYNTGRNARLLELFRSKTFYFPEILHISLSALCLGTYLRGHMAAFLSTVRQFVFLDR